MAEETHEGSCQCGAVRFTATVDLSGAVVCNCSRCRRLGSVLVFAEPGKVTFHAGEGATREYLFNTDTIRHQFCPTCGIEAHAYGRMPDGSPMTAINVNCLDGVDPMEVRKSATFFDGASA